MSTPDDPRVPAERTPDGTEPPTVGPDPTADWTRPEQEPTPDQPPDQPTEQLGAPGYTSDPRLAYGPGQAEHPTQAYPTQAYPTQAYPTQAYPSQGYQAPIPNPTQAYPTYESGQGYGPPPNEPTGAPPEQKRKGPGKGALIAAFTVLALLVAAVVTLGVTLLGSGGPDSTTAAAPSITTRAPLPSTPRPTTPPRPTTAEPTPPDLSRIPGGIGEVIGAAGAAVGNVRSNDGSTLILDGIGGSQVTVTTDATTQVIALGASRVADLKVGETVLVHGEQQSDGSVAARTIIGTAIPNLGGRGGN